MDSNTPETATEPSNSSAVNDLLGHLLPSDPTEPDALAPDAIAKFSALAQDPKLGEKFTLGGREFTRQFLSIDAEQDLIEMILAIVKDAPQGNLLAGLVGSIRKTKKAAALILADQAPECDEAWLSSTRGVTTNQLLALVFAQLEINEVTQVLGKALGLAGLAGALVGAKARA
jgi:hypothetical protein